MEYFKDFALDFNKNRFLKICIYGLIAHVIFSILLYAYYVYTFAIPYIPFNWFIYITLTLLKSVFCILFACGLIL
ncbi:MAG: hypothetical protein ACXQS8_05035, partial [Candidatus Helarchaeales archaeon]